MDFEEYRVNKLMIIDCDAKRAGRLAQRLHLLGFDCEITGSFLFALTKLEWQRPAAILVREELRIDGMTAAEFCAVVKQDSTLGDIVLARAADSNTPRTTSFSRFDLELDGSDPDALAASLVEGVAIASRDSGRDDQRSSSAVTAQDLSPDTGFRALLEMLSTNLSSGRINLHDDGRLQPIFTVLDHGQIVHAVFGGLEGVPAFHRIHDALARGGGIRFAFEPIPRWKLSTFPRTIKLSDRQRLFEARQTENEFDTLDFTVPIRRTE